jgi:hypothetical protein
MLRRAAFVAVLSTVLLAACSLDQTIGKMKGRETLLDDTLRGYAATIRWGDLTQAFAYVDPKYRAEHPLTDLDIARFKQIQITAYNDQLPVPVNENEVRQTVEIGLVNINTQGARSVIDHQVWVYDEAQKKWWLTTGLPDITRH